MSFLSGKKLLFLGFIVVLLIAIPVTVFLVSQQQKIKSSAQAATILSFSAPVPASPKVNDSVSLDVSADPSNINQVGFVKLVINYDPTKFETTTSSFTPATQWTSNGKTFAPVVALGPDYSTPGTISVSLSTDGPADVLTAKTKLGTITLKAIGSTEAGNPTQISFGDQTQVLTAANGEGAENVKAPSAPASIIIAGNASITPTDTLTPTQTLTPTSTPTPTGTLTPTPTGEASANAPSCSSLTLDGDSTGDAPFSVNLTATGTSDNATITKVTFVFGDGQTQDVTDSGGIGTDSISVLTSHTYATSGTFTAKATLTDENGLISSDNCSVAITVNGQTATASPTLTEAPSPLPPTGPNGLVTVGVLGVLLTFIGAALLLAL